MPNHVRNVIKFKKLTPKDKKFILDNFTTELEDDIYPLNRIFDFDKIIPEPRKESECPEDCKVNKDSHIMEDEDRPWFDWYAWHNRFWGTKWNAYDGYVKVGVSTITFVFSTAWSAPLPIYQQLINKYPHLLWEMKFADEDIGSNCGMITWDGEYCIEYCEQDLTHPNDFARRIWNTY